MDYSSAIWGTFSAINKLQNQACRSFLGLGKFTTIVAVQSEMGWITPIHEQWVSVARFFRRLRSMDSERLTKKVFVWAMESAHSRCHNWCWRGKRQLLDLRLGWVLDDEVTDSVFIQAVDGSMLNKVKTKWTSELWREEAKTGNGRNKLRSFRHLKTEFCTEPYITSILPRSARSAFEKIRCGVAPLQIELVILVRQN